MALQPRTVYSAHFPKSITQMQQHGTSGPVPGPTVWDAEVADSYRKLQQIGLIRTRTAYL